MNRGKERMLVLAAAALVALSGCAGGEDPSREGTGVRSTSTTVSQVLEGALQEETPLPEESEEALAPETEEAEQEAESEEPEEELKAEQEQEEQEPEEEQADGIDIDLTQMNSTMVYSEVYSIMADPESFVGKTIRVRGYGSSFYYETTDAVYYSVIIPDASACCAQGMEYSLAEGEDYPEDDTEMVLTGTFEIYEELGYKYCRLGNAVIAG